VTAVCSGSDFGGVWASSLRDSNENLGRKGGGAASLATSSSLVWPESEDDVRSCCGFGLGPRGPVERGGGVDDESWGEVAAIPLVGAEVRTEFREEEEPVCTGIGVDCCFCWSLARSTLILAISDSSRFSRVHAARSLSSTAD